MTSNNEQLVPDAVWLWKGTLDQQRVLMVPDKPSMMDEESGWIEYRIAALRTPPAVEPGEGLVRDIRNQIHAIMAGLVDTVGLIDKNPPGPFAVSKDINESVQALQQVSLKLALFTPSIRAQALEEAWQTIETAPKDGLVLVAGEWPSGEQWSSIGSCCDIGVYGDWDDNLEPTHWIHLPTPPSALKGGQGV